MLYVAVLGSAARYADLLHQIRGPCHLRTRQLSRSIPAHEYPCLREIVVELGLILDGLQRLLDRATSENSGRSACLTR
jgi:hypothetical protein